MTNLRLPLTDAICKSARAEPREYTLRDTRQPALGLRVQPCGSRSWVMRSRTGSKSVRYQLGAFPETGVKAARQIVAALLAQNAEAPPSPSTAPLFEVFQAEHGRRYASSYKPEGLRAYRSYVRCELLPAFAGKRIDEISRPEVIRWFEGYSKRKPGGANRALGILSQMLRCAKAWGHMPDHWRNPTSGIRSNRRKQIGAFLSERQMANLGAVLDKRIADGCAASAALRLLTLTGCRVGEALSLEWRDVLPDRLRLRDSKTGPRDVPIGMPVRAFLREHRKRVCPRDRVATAPAFRLAGNRYCAMQSAWARVRIAADLPIKLRLHDLRHSFASHAVMSGESLYSTSRLLGHSKIQMTARYAHLADETLLAAAEKIGTLMIAQIGGSTDASS